MRESGGHARFPQKPLTRRRRLREFGWKHLDGNVAVELYVAREEHDAHAAASELALQRILAGKSGLEPDEFRRRLRHDASPAPTCSGFSDLRASASVPAADA